MKIGSKRISFGWYAIDFQGTSGAADVIAFGLDAAQKLAVEEVADDKEPVPLENRFVIYIHSPISMKQHLEKY